MKASLVFSVIFIFFLVSSPLFAESTCGTDCFGGWVDCNTGDKDCTYCDPATNKCRDCCAQDPCPGGTFGCDDISPGQCQNKDTHVCISEVPKQSRSWLVVGFGLLAMLLSGGALGYKKVRSTKRPS